MEECFGRQENLIFLIEDEALHRDIGIILAQEVKDPGVSPGSLGERV